MGKIILDDKQAHCGLSESVIQACEQVGLPFGCTNGMCGTCHVKVVHGLDCLSTPTQAEKDFGINLQKGERLMCQCKLTKEGEVKIEYP